jgi:hypothetical protein
VKPLLPTLLAAGVLIACGSEAEPTPSACLAGEDAYLAALDSAPGEVLLDGSVPIGECLVKAQSAGEINTVGSAMIAAATELNAAARRRPTSEATSRLGYLVGAVEAGAADTAGIHTDLVRRINSAARFSDDAAGLGAPFERTFGAGYAAARDGG